MSGKKFISPGAWFSMRYPASWSEAEDSEITFLFYDPVNWSGNFRISAYRCNDSSAGVKNLGKDWMKRELQQNETAQEVKIGQYNCAYSKTMFQENNAYYVAHIWMVDAGDTAFECSFTVAKGADTKPALEMIESLEVRLPSVSYPAEVIPIRITEIAQINESYDWVVSIIKSELKKDFQVVEDDLANVQAIIDSGMLKLRQREAWLALGITICVILDNEIEGFEWMTLIDGNREAPVLKYTPTDMVVDPMKLVWSKVKAGESCNVIDAYKQIIANL